MSRRPVFCSQMGRTSQILRTALIPTCTFRENIRALHRSKNRMHLRICKVNLPLAQTHLRLHNPSCDTQALWINLSVIRMILHLSIITAEMLRSRAVSERSEQAPMQLESIMETTRQILTKLHCPQHQTPLLLKN